MADAPKVYGQKKQGKRIDNRKSASKRGYDKRWRKLRDDYISTHPVCEHCEKKGVTTMAMEVDHIIPFNGVDDPARLDSNNLQSLCRRCHAIKTAKDKSSGHRK